MAQKTFIAPFRVGKKQKRAVLDSRGYEVVVFPIGMEEWAIEYCEFLNIKRADVKPEMYRDKQSGQILTEEEMLELVATDDQNLDGFFKIN